MGIQIEDGKGKGVSAEVSSSGMLKVCAVSSSIEHYVNHHYRKAFMTTFETSASSSDNCVFYIKNTDNIPLIIEGFWIYVDQACDMYMKINDSGTPTNTTSVTPINLNTSSGLDAKCDVYKGNDITGLSGGSEFCRFVFIEETKTEYYNFDQDLIIGENDTFTIYLDTTATINFNIPFNFHNGIID